MNISQREYSRTTLAESPIPGDYRYASRSNDSISPGVQRRGDCDIEYLFFCVPACTCGHSAFVTLVYRRVTVLDKRFNNLFGRHLRVFEMFYNFVETNSEDKFEDFVYF